MTLSVEQLKQLAALAYLQLEESTIAPLTKDLNTIINFVAELQNVDTRDVEPLRSPVDEYQRLRADIVQTDTSLAALKDIAPLFKDNLYLVPKVISPSR